MKKIIAKIKKATSRKPKKKVVKEQYSGILSSDFISLTDNISGKTIHSTKDQLNFKFLIDLYEKKDYNTMLSLVDPFLYVQQNLEEFIEVKNSDFYLKSPTKNYLIPGFHEVMIDLCHDVNSFENLDYFKKFLIKLLNNESITEIPHFLKYLSSQKFMINENGNLFAYKAVRGNYLDKHSGTIDNSPGRTVKMNRWEVTQDSKEECASGLHVGNLRYISGYWSSSCDVLLVTEVDPRDLVSVPGYNQGKIRVCKYHVLCRISFEESLKKNKFLSTEEFVKTYSYVEPVVQEETSEVKLLKSVSVRAKTPKKSKKKELGTVSLVLNQTISDWIRKKLNLSKTKTLTFGTISKSFKKDFPDNKTSELKFAIESSFNFEKNPKIAKSIVSFLENEK